MITDCFWHEIEYNVKDRCCYDDNAPIYTSPAYKVQRSQYFPLES